MPFLFREIKDEDYNDEKARRSASFIEFSSPYDSKDRTLRIGKITLPWPFPVAMMLSSSSARVFGRAVYGKGERPVIRFFHNIFSMIQDAKYWFLYRFVKKHQYNIIYTDLKPGYYDTDVVMLHGMFSLLVQYVENEHGGISKLKERIDWLYEQEKTNTNSLSGSYEIQNDEKALKLYIWWTVERQKNWDDYDAKSHSIYSGKKMVFTPTKVEGFKEDLFEMDLVDTKDSPVPLCTKKELRELKDKLEADDQQALHDLVDIRKTLWT